MERIKRTWTRVPRRMRQPIIFLIGWLVVLAGVIMLVIPGPGWGAIFLGFAILATEFASAAKVRDWLVARLKAVIHFAQHVWDQIRRRHSGKKTPRKK